MILNILTSLHHDFILIFENHIFYACMQDMYLGTSIFTHENVFPEMCLMYIMSAISSDLGNVYFEKMDLFNLNTKTENQFYLFYKEI